MKIQKLSTTNKSFKGTPLSAPSITIKNYSDAIKAWEYLKSAKYLDVHSDKTSFYNRFIRETNYSFLDKLTSSFDKTMFIEKFCEFTKFPNLNATSNKMHNTFIDTIQTISRKLNGSYKNEYEILDAGYDPTCSLGLKKAFPGSDLDKGYVIIRGSEYSDYTDENCVNRFKSELWDNLDQRLVSLNHPDTEVTVYTKKQIKDILNKMNNFVQIKETDEDRFLLVKAGFGILGLALAGPIVAAGWMLNNKYELDHKTDPYVAGKFNRNLAKYIKSSSDRNLAKNFAFFIEAVRENLYKTDFLKTDSLFKEIRNSQFVINSNVTQIPAWREKINDGYLKQKLRNRTSLEYGFSRMSTDTKFDLIKDIIKYSSNDQSYRFSEYFKNDDDISKRYEKLLNALK